MARKINDLPVNNSPADADKIPYSNSNDGADRALEAGKIVKNGDTELRLTRESDGTEFTITVDSNGNLISTEVV